MSVVCLFNATDRAMADYIGLLFVHISINTHDINSYWKQIQNKIMTMSK